MRARAIGIATLRYMTGDLDELAESQIIMDRMIPGINQPLLSLRVLQSPRQLHSDCAPFPAADAIRDRDLTAISQER